MQATSVLLLLGTVSGFAQSTVSPGDRYAYAANAGWIDFRPSAADGVVVSDTYLSGKAHAANFGWIDFGDGSPANGHSYANASAGDFGVNLSAEGRLSGLAYSANCGWISFEPVHGNPRLDYLTGKFTGHAYSANLGWISLDTPSSDLATTSISSPDSDGDGIADAWEMLYFSNLTTAGISPETDADHDGQSDLAEFAAGTHPLDAGNYFRILTQSYGPAQTSAAILFTTASNRLYRLEHAGTLNGTWIDSGLGTFAPDAATQTAKAIALPGGPSRFIRAVAYRPLQP